jgi:hypothetical protein
VTEDGIELMMSCRYGHDADDKDEALRQLAKNLNNKLHKQRCPLAVRFKQPYVYLR